jgi:hypothetical protein
VTIPGKPDPDRGARFLHKLLTEDPAHLDVASDEEVERQMDAAGITVKSVPTAEELMALVAKRAGASADEGTPTGPTATKAPVKRPRPVAIAAAVALGALGVAALANRGVIEAYLRGVEPIGPDTTWTAQQKAALIRGDALDACGTQRWTECTQKLDEAAKLDPAGESDPRVVAARQAVKDATQEPPQEETPLKPRLK